MFVRRALAELGWSPVRGSAGSVESLASNLCVVPQRRGLLARLMTMLAGGGMAQPVEDDQRAEARWRVAQNLATTPDPESEWREMLDQFPAYLAELTLVARCGANLAGILRGQLDPADLLLPRGTPTALEHYCHASASARATNEQAQALVAALVRELPPGRPLRILEANAGTGGLASFLLPVLPRHATNYVFSDPSPTFVALAKRKLHAYPFVDCRALDLEADPQAQGFEPQSFDLIVVSDLLRQAIDPQKPLANIQRLLAPGGLLLQIEDSGEDCLRTLADAILPGRHQDATGPVVPCTLPLDRWHAMLVDAGFRDITNLAEPEAPNLQRGLYLCQGPRLPRDTTGSDEADNGHRRASQADAGGRWLILTDRTGIGHALAERMEKAGHQVVVVDQGDRFQRTGERRYCVRAGESEDMRRLLQGLSPEATSYRGIVHLWSLESSPTVDDLPHQALVDSLTALHLVQACAATSWATPPRVYLVTGGVHRLLSDESPRVASSPIWGLGRVVRNEHPEWRCTMIDLGLTPGDADAHSLYGELSRDTVEDEIALRGADRYVHRLLPMTSIMPDRLATTAGVRLTSRQPGSLESLCFQSFARQSPGPYELEIEVEAAALNFKDLAKAMKLLGAESLRNTWSGSQLGMECAGRVTAVGADVRDLRIGERVLAQAPGCLASHVIVDGRMVLPLPDGLDAEAAVTMPVAFATASYALEELARVRADERVLIHAAAGGVGLAAVQIARQAGAEVFATAGSPEKRDFLRLLGVRHIMDSRTLDFGRQIMDASNGNGVDVVLNSLAGPALARSLSVLAPGGRFLELGKRDIEQDTRLGLRPFQDNQLFNAVDLDRLWAKRPEMLIRSVAEVLRRLNAGNLHPLPYRVFPFSQARAAFEWMARASHIGKVVLSLQDPVVPTVARDDSSIRFRADASYLIAGGLGGFGLATARWLVDCGARNLVLVGRSGATTAEAQQALREMERAGAHVEVVQADVVCRDQLGHALERAGDLAPLRGVFHAAMVLEDAMLSDQDAGKFERVMAPKVAGAWNLHRLTTPMALDHFVLFSSTAAVFGSPGQANYAAANAFLDALAHHRCALGLPALSVNWTAVADVGYVAQHGDIRAHLERSGFVPLTSRFLLQALGTLLKGAAVQAAVMRLDWSRAGAHALAATSPRLSRIVGVSGRTSGDRAVASSQERLRTLAGPARREFLGACLREQAGKALGIATTSFDMDSPLTNIGMDSLLAIDFGLRLKKELGVDISVLRLMRGITLNHLLDEVAERLPVKVSVRHESGNEASPATKKNDAGLADVAGPTIRRSDAWQAQNARRAPRDFTLAVALSEDEANNAASSDPLQESRDQNEGTDRQVGPGS